MKKIISKFLYRCFRKAKADYVKITMLAVKGDDLTIEQKDSLQESILILAVINWQAKLIKNVELSSDIDKIMRNVSSIYEINIKV